MDRRVRFLLVGALVVLATLPLMARVLADVDGQQAKWSIGSRLRGMFNWLRALKQRLWWLWSSELDDEFREKAVVIAEQDADVRTLLAEGYRVMRVIPIVKPRVNSDGSVTVRATRAILLLRNKSFGSYAVVWVDLEAEAVTKIVTLSRTVIKGS